MITSGPRGLSIRRRRVVIGDAKRSDRGCEVLAGRTVGMLVVAGHIMLQARGGRRDINSRCAEAARFGCAQNLALTAAL